MNIGFIGGGTMAEAILGGMLEGGVAAAGDVMIGEPVPARRDYLAERYGVGVSDSNAPVADASDLVVMAVKPQDLPKVYSDIGGGFNDGQSIMSIVAGTKMKSLADGMRHDGIIRVMPNTPAQIGEGMTMWTCAASVSKAHRDTTSAILSTIGDEIYVDDEKYLDMATALSASGPAYVFMILEAMIDAGVYVGLPRDVARRLALQTVKGSTELVVQTGRHPAELKDMVTSPGGTTAEGLQALERAGVPAAVVDAVNAAYLKSIRLGQE
ncbi:MAG: pyrroline-5-carboxylate reductase [Chloroflexi bacterium]|nr:pyrroline-5-carboxylate reductase [Chloroflexota bacterium]